MISAELPTQGVVFWSVGHGDSTTIVIDDGHVVQVDLHDMAVADEDDALVAAVIDRLVEVLPEGQDGRPYLAAFVLTHADQDHCLGFTDLLDEVTIGEIWATPRLWREYTEKDVPLCTDAKAFQEESERRVAATCEAVAAGRQPASGDRIRVIGYDTDHSKHAYSELPDEYLSYPGDAVTSLDGEDLADRFEAFIHAPFKDDCAAERNDTSVALQISLRAGSQADGRVLLLGDLAYETIKKIFDYSECHGRPERLAWDVLLAPHHCSKKVMYVAENGEEVLKQDILDAFARHAGENATIVASSDAFPAKNAPGDNPPHVKARNRYQEIVTEVVCTGEHPSAEAPQPVVFALGPDGLQQLPTEDVERAPGVVAKASTAGQPVAAGSILAGALAAGAAAARWQRARRQAPQQRGLNKVRGVVASSRGDDAAPQQPVGFGGR